MRLSTRISIITQALFAGLTVVDKNGRSYHYDIFIGQVIEDNTQGIACVTLADLIMFCQERFDEYSVAATATDLFIVELDEKNVSP